MSTAAPIPPITGTVTINAPAERAFRVFAQGINTWWPHQYHIGQADIAEVVLEPRVGGRWYERGVDDSECDWGRVLAWEPPHRLVFTWQVSGEWQLTPTRNTPARSRCGSAPTDPSRPPSTSNTAAWTD